MMRVPFSGWSLGVILGLLGLLAGCAHQLPAPLPYDPPGSTDTRDRIIERQVKRTIGFRKAGVWASNEFEGARLSDFVQLNDTLLAINAIPLCAAFPYRAVCMGASD